MSFRRAAAVDRNQPEIVAALRKSGATVIITSQLKNAFDILVCFRGKIFIVEIKDGEKPPSQRKLKDGEMECKKKVEAVGCDYWVIKSVDEALKMITGKLFICPKCKIETVSKKGLCENCNKT